MGVGFVRVGVGAAAVEGSVEQALSIINTQPSYGLPKQFSPLLLIMMSPPIFFMFH